MEETALRFRCVKCGLEHDLEELSFATDAPAQWDLLKPDERTRSILSGEQCEIESNEGSSFYIRACLDIPIRGANCYFNWGVWCSLSEKSYREVHEHWEDPQRMQLGPYLGWLCTVIPGYPDTMFLKTMVHQRAVGQRPSVELEPSDHSLSVDQRFGIEMPRLREIVVELLHAE